MNWSLKELMLVIVMEYRLTKGIRMRSVIVLFRLASYPLQSRKFVRYFFLPFTVIYKIYSEFLLGIELPAGTKIGKGLRLFHCVGLVVHKDARLGQNCILRQGVTIGNKGEGENNRGSPVIEDNVEFGAGSIVIGPVSIGSNVIVGAGAVVSKDIPGNSIVISQPVRIISKNI